MKKIVILLVLAGIAGMSFANGTSEQPSQTAPAQAYGRMGFGYGGAVTGEVIKATGKLSLNALVYPVLKTADGKSYNLMVPQGVGYSLQIKDGDTVSIEGFQITNPPTVTDDKAVFLHVTKATINGKEYDLTALMGPRGGYDRMGGGMMGGPGGRRGR